jgi:hypothetical protein
MTSVRIALIVAALLTSGAVTTHAQPDATNVTLRSVVALEGVHVFTTADNALQYYVLRAGGNSVTTTVRDLIYSHATRELYHGTQATIVSSHTEDGQIRAVPASLDVTEVIIDNTDGQSWWVATINVFPNR